MMLVSDVVRVAKGHLREGGWSTFGIGWQTGDFKDLQGNVGLTCLRIFLNHGRLDRCRKKKWQPHLGFPVR